MFCRARGAAEDSDSHAEDNHGTDTQDEPRKTCPPHYVEVVQGHPRYLSSVCTTAIPSMRAINSEPSFASHGDALGVIKWISLASSIMLRANASTAPHVAIDVT